MAADIFINHHYTRHYESSEQLMTELFNNCTFSHYPVTTSSLPR